MLDLCVSKIRKASFVWIFLCYSTTLNPQVAECGKLYSYIWNYLILRPATYKCGMLDAEISLKDMLWPTLNLYPA